MSIILSFTCFVAAIILMVKGNVDRSLILLLLSALFSISSSLYLIWSEVKTIKALVKDKILAEKTMAALYKAVKERAEEDDHK